MIGVLIKKGGGNLDTEDRYTEERLYRHKPGEDSHWMIKTEIRVMPL